MVIDKKNVLETYQFEDTTVGAVIPYTERMTLYGHLKPGDTVLIKRYKSSHYKRKGQFFQRLVGEVKRSNILTSAQRNLRKNNRSIEMDIEIKSIHN